MIAKLTYIVRHEIRDGETIVEAATIGLGTVDAEGRIHLRLSAIPLARDGSLALTLERLPEK